MELAAPACLPGSTGPSLWKHTTHLAVGFSLSYQRRIINGFSCWGDLEWESSPAASWHTCLRGAELHFLQNYEGAQVTWSEETVPIEQLGEVWSEHLIGPTHDAPLPHQWQLSFISPCCAHTGTWEMTSPEDRKEPLRNRLRCTDSLHGFFYFLFPAAVLPNLDPRRASPSGSA